MQKVQLAAALVAVLGFALHGPAGAADKNELSVKETSSPSEISKKVNLADEEKAPEAKKEEKKTKKTKSTKAKKEAKGTESSCKSKEASKGKEGSCKGKEGSCKTEEKKAE